MFFISFVLEFFNFAIGESFLILWLRLAWCSLFSFGWGSLILPLVNHSLYFGFVLLVVLYFQLAWCSLISVDGLEFFNFAIGESFLILWLHLAWCFFFSFGLGFFIL